MRISLGSFLEVHFQAAPVNSGTQPAQRPDVLTESDVVKRLGDAATHVQVQAALGRNRDRTRADNRVYDLFHELYGQPLKVRANSFVPRVSVNGEVVEGADLEIPVHWRDFPLIQPPRCASRSNAEVRLAGALMLLNATSGSDERRQLVIIGSIEDVVGRWSKGYRVIPVAIEDSGLVITDDALRNQELLRYGDFGLSAAFFGNVVMGVGVEGQ